MYYVETDGSDLGYLHLVQLSLMGRQFYLDWHAYYNDLQLIATAAARDRLIEALEGSDFGYPLTKKQVRKAAALDPTPVVEAGSDTMSLRVFWFTKWGGFHESWYDISKAAPHTITKRETNVLLEYECGVMF